MPANADAKQKLVPGKAYWVRTPITVGVCLVTVVDVTAGGKVAHLRADDCFEQGEREGFCCGATRPFVVADVTVVEAG